MVIRFEPPPPPEVAKGKPHTPSCYAAFLSPLTSQVSRRSQDALVFVSIVLAIFGVYAQTAHFDFVSFDDAAYVYENAHVRAGLTLDSIRWACTAVVAGNWAPVTLLSHILVWQVFGVDSGMHHLVNVLLHALASVLLFVVLRRATAATWPSAFVAFGFALHPLHVESVAWVAERKDVLSALFWFLALYAYVRYAEAPSMRWYLTVAGWFALGLMSKSMLVTFPFALLLFDVWPLRRVQWPKMLLEKLPLMLLSAIAAVATYFVQRSAGAVSGADVTLGLRVEICLISYIAYIGNMFWPTHLDIFFMYSSAFAAWGWAGALAILVGISAVAVYTRRSLPYLATGWFWYLGTLVPVIGLVQVGAQARADRYTYVPMVGLLWILAWGAVDVLKKWPRAKPAIAIAAVVSCAACIALSLIQVGYWQNSVTLFQHALDVTENNILARNNLSDARYVLGNNLMNSGHASEAIVQFQQVLRLRPDYVEAHNNLGILLARVPGHSADAIAQFEAAVQIDPKLAQAHRNLGVLLSSVPGRRSEAISQLEQAQHLRPDPDLPQMIERVRAAEQQERR